MVPKTGRFADADRYEGQTWEDYLWDIRGALLTLLGQRMTSTWHVQAMLTAIGQGLENGVYVMRDLISIKSTKPWPNKDLDQPAPPTGPSRFDRRLFDWQELVDCDLPRASRLQYIRQRFFQRRVIATVVHFESPAHWATLIYDQERKQLGYYDSLPDVIGSRARAASLAWRFFLVNLGFEAEFTTTAVKLRPQTSPWPCGFIAVTTILHATRVLAGDSLSVAALSSTLQGLNVDGHSTPVTGPSRVTLSEIALPLPDWSFSAPSVTEASSRVRGVIVMLLCNELGIQTSEQLANMFNHQRGYPRFEFGLLDTIRSSNRTGYHMATDLPPVGTPNEYVGLLKGSRHWAAVRSRVFVPNRERRFAVFGPFYLPPNRVEAMPQNWPLTEAAQAELQETWGVSRWDELAKSRVRRA